MLELHWGDTIIGMQIGDNQTGMCLQWYTETGAFTPPASVGYRRYNVQFEEAVKAIPIKEAIFMFNLSKDYIQWKIIYAPVLIMTSNKTVDGPSCCCYVLWTESSIHEQSNQSCNLHEWAIDKNHASQCLHRWLLSGPRVIANFLGGILYAGFLQRMSLLIGGCIPQHLWGHVSAWWCHSPLFVQMHNWLNNYSPDTWTCCRDRIVCPPQSSAMYLLFFLWGCNKENVYAKEEQHSDNLINCILVAPTDNRGKPRQLVHVRDVAEECCELCMHSRKE